jgi:RNA polymerase sigma factor (sigma-70 family)
MMVRAQTATILWAARKGTGPGDLPGPPDGDLLDRFLGPDRTAAEEAFQELVGRHGPSVLGVCRHVLGQAEDAEDAFQTTFLILAREAGRIRHRRLLDRWLYQVAYRIAVRSRIDSSRRRQHERQDAKISVVSPDLEHDPAWREQRTVLHKEVSRLPENYRGAIMLCYFEERSNGEAAALLRWPVGTVKGRLARARALLRARLTRRGLAPDRTCPPCHSGLNPINRFRSAGSSTRSRNHDAIDGAPAESLSCPGPSRD